MDTKPNEELYDLENDPYEVHNLANDPKHAERMTNFRKALANWQLEIGDKGFIPEHELIQLFWPEFLQPITSEVTFTSEKRGKIALATETEGASIGYQLDEEIGGKHWNLYHSPIKLAKNQKITARAIRIGYKASTITSK